MKTTTAGMDAHLALECTTLCTIAAITRLDGTVFYITDLDTDIPFGGNTYKSSAGYQRSALRQRINYTVDTLDIDGFFETGYIERADVRKGLFDHATAKVSVINYEDTSDGEIILIDGQLGEVVVSSKDQFSFQVRGLMQRVRQKVGKVYQPMCAADVGDARCTVPITPDLRLDSTAYAVGDFVRVATNPGSGFQDEYENRIYECTTAGTTAGTAPTFDTTVGNTTTDGTAVFTAREAWTRHAVVATVTDVETFTITITETRAVDDWFRFGVVTFENGDNSGISREVKSWTQSGASLTLFVPLPVAPTVGDKLRIYPGCDRRVETCGTKWTIAGSTNFDSTTLANTVNFRGFPDLPGTENTSDYPDRI